MSWRDGGLKQKFVIRKICTRCKGQRVTGCGYGERCEWCEGTGHIPAPSAAKYFVLRIDCDPETGEAHDQTARDALYHYAIIMLSKNKEFGEDILRWLDQTSPNRGAKEEKSTN